MKSEDEHTVTGLQQEYILVPRIPTPEMLSSEAVKEAALDEDACDVWKYMIRAFEESQPFNMGNSDSGKG